MSIFHVGDRFFWPIKGTGGLKHRKFFIFDGKQHPKILWFHGCQNRPWLLFLKHIFIELGICNFYPILVLKDWKNLFKKNNQSQFMGSWDQWDQEWKMIWGQKNMSISFQNLWKLNKIYFVRYVSIHFIWVLEFHRYWS